jgi:hypothetical protein
MSTLASIFQWLHDQQAAKYIHWENAKLLDRIKQGRGEEMA